MCGITGIVNLSNDVPIDRDRLLCAVRTLVHRGPDAEGVHVTTEAGVAARRLSIIDVANGHQPVHSEDGRVTAVLNGEIYNHRELRQELVARGHRFRSEVDTEILVHGFEEWGFEALLERLQGMFAFAVLNERELWIARDRLGIKPLYYTEYDGRLGFSSEVRGLLELTGRPAEINLPALDSFLRVGFVSNPHSMFKGVLKLPGAHYLHVANRRVRCRRYWLPFGRVEPPRSEAEAVEEFTHRLEDAVASHLESEVPLGCLLSGGIDSTMIAALTQEQSAERLQTISIGFDLGPENESELCRENAAFLDTEHHHIQFDASGFDAFPEILTRLEEPIKDPVSVVWDQLFRACRDRGLTVILSGAGADEALGGYYWHRRDEWCRPLLGLPRMARSWLARGPRIRNRSRLSAQLLAGPRPAHQRYQGWIAISDPRRDPLEDLWADELRCELGSNGSILDGWAGHTNEATDESPLNQMLWVQAQTRMIDECNHELDRMSMAHSVEARVPFLDHRLWEYCMAVPDRWKVKRTGLRYTEKYLLREACRKRIPESTRLRKKQGLNAPYQSWFRRSQAPEWIEDLLSDDAIRRVGYFSAGTVRDLRRRARTTRDESASLLMAVLSLQTWAHVFLDSPSPQVPV